MVMQQRELAITLWRQTWPMAIGVLALLGFQLVDSAFIARLGSAQLTAVIFDYRHSSGYGHRYCGTYFPGARRRGR